MRHPSLLPFPAASTAAAASPPVLALTGGAARRYMPAPRSALAALLAGLSLLAGALPAMAGRPLATDDAAIVEHGSCQIELWREQRKGSEQALWANPGCNPWGGTEFSLAFGRTRGSGGANGATLNAWQIKQLLRETEGSAPGFALALRGERDRRMHRGGLLAGDLAVNGIASWPLGSDDTRLHTNLGLRRERDDFGAPALGSTRRTRATWGAALDWAGPAATRPFAELYGTSSERAHWQAGLRWPAREGVQLDFAFGAQAGRWSSTRQFSLGVVLVAPVLR